MAVYTEMISENPEWEFAGLYADEGISGTRADKRPQFTKMINDCLNGKIDMIITKSVSRFARNTVECLEYVRMLKARGIGIIFEEQNINTLKTDSELYLVIYAGFAQSESESMSKNITWAAKYFKSMGHMLETSDGAHAITLCHYPMLTWNHQRKSYMIHGHIHNNTDIDFWPLMIRRGNILNAGVDMNGFKPVQFDELLENNRAFVEDYLESSARKAQMQNQMLGF